MPQSTSIYGASYYYVPNFFILTYQNLFHNTLRNFNLRYHIQQIYPSYMFTLYFISYILDISYFHIITLNLSGDVPRNYYTVICSALYSAILRYILGYLSVGRI